MRFVHIADTHLDSAFNFLTDKADIGYIRRMDQRNAIKRMINYIKENNIPYLFISGDLYEHSSIKESTIEYINKLFKQIPNTKIFITPGNHDPLIKNSYYNLYNWADNVKILGSKLTKIEEEEFYLYGFGFDNFTMNSNELNKIIISDKSKLNILITHASLDGSKDQNQYNPITTRELNDLDFDYVALGHIHKRNLEYNDQKIVYPGSTCSLGFDELGEHGMVVGEITKKNGEVKRNIQFIKLDDKEFVREECMIDDMNSLEDLADFINSKEYEEKKLYELILTGGRSFEINNYRLGRLINKDNVVKIKDKTKISIDLEKLTNDSSLKGIFIKKMLEKLEQEEYDKEIIEKAIEYGLQSLEGKN